MDVIGLMTESQVFADLGTIQIEGFVALVIVDQWLVVLVVM